MKLNPVDRARLSWQPGDVKPLEDRIKKSGDYSHDMKTYGLYQSSTAVKSAFAARIGGPVTANLFSDLVTEKARVDAAHGWHQASEVEKVGPHGYVHGWIKETPGVSAGLPAEDRAAVAAHRADDAATAEHTEPAAPGSHGHAEELRQLGNEANLHEGRSYISMSTSKPGMSSDLATSIGAGSHADDIPESDAGRALHRAAKMVDNGQPSLARLHSGTIRDAARRARKADPAYADRLSAAADKLDQLPASAGLAALPPESADEQARTAAARRYAKKVAELDAELEELRSGSVAAKWYNHTMNEEAGTPDVAKVGPKGYVHGWIKEGAPGLKQRGFTAAFGGDIESRGAGAAHMGAGGKGPHGTTHAVFVSSPDQNYHNPGKYRVEVTRLNPKTGGESGGKTTSTDHDSAEDALAKVDQLIAKHGNVHEYNDLDEASLPNGN